MRVDFFSVASISSIVPDEILHSKNSSKTKCRGACLYAAGGVSSRVSPATEISLFLSKFVVFTFAVSQFASGALLLLLFCVACYGEMIYPAATSARVTAVSSELPVISFDSSCRIEWVSPPLSFLSIAEVASNVEPVSQSLEIAGNAKLASCHAIRGPPCKGLWRGIEQLYEFQNTLEIDYSA